MPGKTRQKLIHADGFHESVTILSQRPHTANAFMRPISRHKLGLLPVLRQIIHIDVVEQVARRHRRVTSGNDRTNHLITNLTRHLVERRSSYRIVSMPLLIAFARLTGLTRRIQLYPSRISLEYPIRLSVAASPTGICLPRTTPYSLLLLAAS